MQWCCSADNDGNIILMIWIGQISKKDKCLLTSSFLSYWFQTWCWCWQKGQLTLWYQYWQRCCDANTINNAMTMMLWCCYCHCGTSDNGAMTLIIYIGHTSQLDKQLLIDSLLLQPVLTHNAMTLTSAMSCHQCASASNESHITLIVKIGYIQKLTISYQLTACLFHLMVTRVPWY